MRSPLSVPDTAGDIAGEAAGRALAAALDHVVYVLANPLNARDYERFGMGFLLDAGCRVTALDISALIHPGMTFDRANFRPDPRMTLRAVTGTHGIADEAATFRSAALIVFVAQSFGPSSRNLAALRLITRSGRPYLIFGVGAVPRVGSRDRRPGLIERLSGPNRTLDWSAIVDRIIRRLPLAALGLRPADFIVHDGRASARPNPLVGPSTERIFAHSFDYEKARHLMGVPTGADGTAVFLDQFIPYHQDFVIQGLSAHLDAERYFASLRRLFDQIERALGLKVVIAAHPRADYGKLDVFGGRPIVAARTAELVRDCSLVIVHSSTATGFAALFSKPVMVVASPEMLDLNIVFSGQIRGIAEALNVPLRLISPDADIDLAVPPTVDAGAYDAFVENYVKVPGTPDRPFWQIVVDAAARRGSAVAAMLE